MTAMSDEQAMTAERAPATGPTTNPTPEPPSGSRPRVVVSAGLRHPFAVGFLVVLGGLVAAALGGALASLSTVLVSVGVALFIAMALEPLVAWLTRHKMSRALAIAVVFAAFALVGAIILAVIIPIAVVQIGELAKAIPGFIIDIQNSPWFHRLIELSGDNAIYDGVLDQVRAWLSNPSNLLAIGGGAFAVGSGLVNGVAGALIVLVLTLYFLASLQSMKDAVVRLAPAYARPKTVQLTDQLTESVGGYVSGMAVLAASNAVFTLILMSILRVPFAPLLAVLALFITMIPMIGSVLFWIIASIVSLFTIGWVGLVFAGIYFAYMQVEAYVMTPRVMTKAVSIPGSLVLIGAMVGATLLGLLGALIAVPVTASLLTILNEVFVPKQDAKTDPEAG